MMRRPPTSTLFPNPTLFRSDQPTGLAVRVRCHRRTHFGREGITALPEQHVLRVSQSAGFPHSGYVSLDAFMILRTGNVENASLQQLSQVDITKHFDRSE